ncbi:hypothetical protein [Winogradskyella bathintestinalis]|uniref:Lipocalin-like domain-containing protein n=1 Tax=Winogradskyella bathintestinalis TaxID=3035208 RepID=A0ABT7ZS43_9FLAO|nr:hypothetical protein [Winogradskyella bathintestinalis]MDN3491558.1 hypothetical protein [Winogradskyella bathintestinalis]
MKKIVSLFCLFTMLTAFTCENEPLDDGIDSETDTGVNNVDIIGTWDLTDFDVTLTSSTEFNGQNLTSEIAIQSTEENYVLNLTPNNFTTNGSYAYDTNIIVNGETFSSEPYMLENVNGSGTYSINGNEMTIDGEFFEFEYEGSEEDTLNGEQTVMFTISADGQTLTFSQDETTSETDTISGIVTSNTTNSTSIWTRQ